jgi:hypothetical protein
MKTFVNPLIADRNTSVHIGKNHIDSTDEGVGTPTRGVILQRGSRRMPALRAFFEKFSGRIFVLHKFTIGSTLQIIIFDWIGNVTAAKIT